MAPLVPRAPPEPPPAQRGGFFRALTSYRKPEADGEYDFTSAVPSASSGPTYADLEADVLGRGRLEAGGAKGSAQQPMSANLSFSMFLEKLTLSFIDKLWVGIKKNSMLTSASSRGGAAVNETICEADFLRLAKKLMGGYTAEDEGYLEQLFRRVDQRKRGAVRTTDIATALVLICHDDPIPKMRSLFRVFDSDDDSCLLHDEIFDMYLSIKVNNITKSSNELRMDAFFDDELSLQEAKRLYELTVVHLNAVSDFIIFDEFKHIFDDKNMGKFLSENLLPGAFSLEWILGSRVEPPAIEAAGPQQQHFARDVQRRFLEAARRGDEHLNLSTRRGRGTRIMVSCLSSHRASGASAAGEDAFVAGRDDGDGSGGAVSSTEGRRKRGTTTQQQSMQGSGELPALTSAGAGRRRLQKVGGQANASGAANGAGTASGGGGASLGAGASGGNGGSTGAGNRYDEDGSDDSSSENDDDISAPGRGVVSTLSGGGPGVREHGIVSIPSGHGHGSGAGSGSAGRHATAGYSMEEAMALPQLQVLSQNHSSTKLFRGMTLDPKTQQAYLRDKKDVNRNLRYQCLVCAINHEFKLNAAGGDRGAGGRPGASGGHHHHHHSHD